jgi:hypothetical protein
MSFSKWLFLATLPASSVGVLSTGVGAGVGVVAGAVHFWFVQMPDWQPAAL